MPFARKISIIVPVYNEEKTLADVIRALHDADTCGWQKEIIIVDDGSRDASRHVLQESPYADDLTVIVHDVNQGKGAAIRTGLAAASGDAVLIQDADMEYDPADIAGLLMAYDRHGGGAVIYGSREMVPVRKGYPHYVLGVRALTMLANISFGSSLTDIYTGYKLFPAAVMKAMPITSAGFEFEAEVTARLLGAGIAIVEVPIRYNPRSFQEGKKIGALDGLRGIATIFSHWWNGHKKAPAPPSAGWRSEHRGDEGEDGYV
ncbi:MAG: glycosyltransferase family 2 protein [Candidatus Sungbacteria bacterium]|nr:glycosyltransferase family 2 protein [Candidatus Sungbacteria bacterium]